MKLLKPKGARTNVDSVIGKEVLITAEVDNLCGRGEGKTGGAAWSVRSADGCNIPVGETVVVDRVEGVKLIVKRKDN